ncbi:MAG: hypothetical protein KDC52_18565 [Ignavibacteriae bacterium]|nr:hypothetical protein [Ignavibacteriota bacterium]
MISDKLIKKTLNYFDSYSRHDVVVKPSLPILYFGSLESYKSSDLKIITVGKNPSDNEFRLKKGDPFSFVRFPDWDQKKGNLIESLNPYFEKYPLKWFSCFEPILNGFSASYYQGHNSTALHTDVCSPLATNPTWSKLSKDTQSKFFNGGLDIWRDLVEELQPDLMLASIPRTLFNYVFKSKGNELLIFNKKKDGTARKRPYIVELHEYRLKSGKKVKVIFGQAANTPFSTISNEQKLTIGKSPCLT